MHRHFNKLMKRLLPTDNSAWRYYFRLYHNLYFLLLLGACIALGQALPLLGITSLLRYALNHALPHNDFATLALCAGLMILLSVVITLITLKLRRVTLRITKGVVLKLREDLLLKCYALSWHFHSRADAASLHSRLVNETERLDAMTNAFIASFLPAVISSLALCFFMLLVNRILFSIAVGLILVFFIINYVMRGRVKAKTLSYYRAYENFSKGILFVLQKMRLTQTQTAEEFEIRRQQKYFHDLRESSTNMAWLTAAYSSIQDNAAVVFMAILLLMGGAGIINKMITVGDLLSFYVAVTLLKNYLSLAASSFVQIMNGEESLNRVYNVLQMTDLNPYSGKKLIDFQGKIVFDNVFFQYEDIVVLKAINFTLTPGSVVLLHGENGAGKTTIINLILGFYRPQQGGVYADDCCYDSLDLGCLRKKIGIVMQNPALFNGTVRENLCYGCEQVTFEKIREATRLIAAHDFIEQLPQGYDTSIGENGVQLSGGQRQRLAIARALLRDPVLLILDEPTNHLDSLAIQQLLTSLKKLPSRPTILMISHDLSLSVIAERSFLLANGGVQMTQASCEDVRLQPRTDALGIFNAPPVN